MNSFEIQENAENTRRQIIELCKTAKSCKQISDELNIYRSLVDGHVLALVKAGNLKKIEDRQYRQIYVFLTTDEVYKPLSLNHKKKEVIPPPQTTARRFTMESYADKILLSDKMRRDERKSSKIFVSGSTLLNA